VSAIYPERVSEDELGPLPAGRHGLSREQVSLNQRERLIGGLAEAVTEHGYNAVTITHITKSARVSRRAFYENFDSKEDCFLAAFEVVVGHIRELAAKAVEPTDDWPHEVVAAFRAALGFLSAEPDLARLCLVESLAAGPAVAERFRQTVYGFTPLLERGRGERSSDRPLPESTESSLIGALVNLASRSIIASEAQNLIRLVPDFVEFALSPYLGPQEAHRLAAEAGEGI
jgi:AcrR family transcriptional regulator